MKGIVRFVKKLPFHKKSSRKTKSFGVVNLVDVTKIHPSAFEGSSELLI
jgi:hypothetical protein